jgi:hypothetical protein
MTKQEELKEAWIAGAVTGSRLASGTSIIHVDSFEDWYDKNYSNAEYEIVEDAVIIKRKWWQNK